MTTRASFARNSGTGSLTATRRAARWQDKEAALAAETETSFEMELETLLDELARQSPSLGMT